MKIDQNIDIFRAFNRAVQLSHRHLNSMLIFSYPTCTTKKELVVKLWYTGDLLRDSFQCMWKTCLWIILLGYFNPGSQQWKFSLKTGLVVIADVLLSSKISCPVCPREALYKVREVSWISLENISTRIQTKYVSVDPQLNTIFFLVEHNFKLNKTSFL